MKTKITKEGWMVYENDTHLSRWIEQLGRLDTEGFCNGVLVPMLKPGDHVVDGGASLGDHTYAYSKAVGAEGLVHAFEITPWGVACLRHNMKHGRCTNVVIHECGLSDRVEHVQMKMDPNVGASHIARLGETELMSCLPLDWLHLGRLDFMKLDIEGYEYYALLGAVRTILKFKPIICLEFNKARLDEHCVDFEELYGLMDSLGYKPRPHDGEVYEYGYDQVFFPR